MPCRKNCNHSQRHLLSQNYHAKLSQIHRSNLDYISLVRPFKSVFGFSLWFSLCFSCCFYSLFDTPWSKLGTTSSSWNSLLWIPLHEKIPFKLLDTRHMTTPPPEFPSHLQLCIPGCSAEMTHTKLDLLDCGCIHCIALLPVSSTCTVWQQIHAVTRPPDVLEYTIHPHIKQIHFHAVLLSNVLMWWFSTGQCEFTDRDVPLLRTQT